ncbi:MAG TPA: hypothetical protein VKX33_04415 [Cyclobacteriaceae bacterium]|nr:hypothetical protein [Cyclobacteriaceae bacterium]
MNISYSSGGWQPIVSNVLRIQVAQRDHVARLYGKKPNFSDLLENFIINGIGIKDIVLVVATSSSLTEFHNRLEMSIFEEEDLTLHDMYIPLGAENTLIKFMIHDWQEEVLFLQYMEGLAYKADEENPYVRLFWEMVEILWTMGEMGNTIGLEALWNKFPENKKMSLFWSYPRSGFTHLDFF